MNDSLSTSTAKKGTLIRKCLLCLLCVAFTASNLFASPFPQVSLKKGVFLVATNNLVGSGFEKTVVLITKHSKYGAMGLAINKPTELAASDVFPSLKSLKIHNKLHLGGPVHPQAMLLLIKSTNSHDMPAIIKDVYFSGGQRTLKKIMKDIGPNDTVKAFAGYSGWSPGQLEAEINRGDWKVTAADKSSIFEIGPENLWQRLAKSLSGKWI